MPVGYKQYAIVVYNDDDHTFEYVIRVFVAVFRYNAQKCDQLAVAIHRQGKAVVWTGVLEHAELKLQQICSAPADNFGTKVVSYPLQAEIRQI
jgi:ATP-dependent Clp protease adaptor protein ClpS